MSPFAETLREIAGDLEDLREHYLAEGLSDEEARRRVVEEADISDESLAALARVHGGPLRRLPAGMLGALERALLLLILLFAAGASLGLSRHETLLAAAGPFAWPVLLAALAALALALPKGYLLFLKRDHEPRRLRRGLDELLALAGTQIFLGFMGSWAEALRLSMLHGGDPAARVRSALDWALLSSALLQLSLGLALLTGLAWFFLAGRVARAEAQEAELLLSERGTR